MPPVDPTLLSDARIAAGYLISFRDYARIGLPVTVLTLVIGSLWLAWVRP
ncbi:MAG: hypothetical protein HYU37_01970 [Acidobacteria bacterium]|nr:hypothetical protein [Acidobacteriota bacterium]